MTTSQDESGVCCRRMSGVKPTKAALSSQSPVQLRHAISSKWMKAMKAVNLLEGQRQAVIVLFLCGQKGTRHLSESSMFQTHQQLS